MRETALIPKLLQCACESTNSEVRTIAWNVLVRVTEQAPGAVRGGMLLDLAEAPLAEVFASQVVARLRPSKSSSGRDGLKKKDDAGANALDRYGRSSLSPSLCF